MTITSIRICTDAGVMRSAEEIKKDVADALEFERKLAKIQVPQEERRDQTELYNKFRLSEMAKFLSEIDWTKYFDWRMLSTTETEEKDKKLQEYLDGDPVVVVRQPTFFKNLSKLLQSTPKRVLANYIFWQYSLLWVNQLDERFDQIRMGSFL